MNHPTRIAVVAAVGSVLLLPTAAAAHEHEAGPAHHGEGQTVANGQNHPSFASGLSCESFGAAPGGPMGPAWYGIETAHHGPDSGAAGRGDGCYQIDGTVPADDTGPSALE